MVEDENDAARQQDGAKSSTWGQERRLQFIDFRLQWEGRLNRSDLTAFFGISIPQASLDLSKYIEAAPSNLRYDNRSRMYVADERFQAIYPRSSPQRYLHDLLATSSGITDRSSTFLGWHPEVAVAPRPSRTVETPILASIIMAMRDQHRSHVRYQSMTSDQPTERELSPHALAYDGFRWHVRAYCHARNRFQDFVIARILQIATTGPSDVDSTTDVAWHHMLNLVLTAHPELPASARRAIEADYGMTNGEVTLKCRRALLLYTLRNLRLERVSTEDATAAQIWLKNREELAPHIQQVMPPPVHA